MTSTPEQTMDVDKDKEQMPPPSSAPSSVAKGAQKSEEKKQEAEPADAGDDKKATPAVIRTRKLRGAFQSPSDAVMSPFSQSLNKAIHHPALLKRSQKPKRLQGMGSLDDGEGSAPK